MKKHPPKGKARAIENPTGSRQITGTLSSNELALIAATLNPAACRSRDAAERRSTLLHAAALWLEADAVTRELNQLLVWGDISRPTYKGQPDDSSGANHLVEVQVQALPQPLSPFFTLARKDQDADTVRPYLQKNLNLEGKKPGRKSWGNVQTVWRNFRWFYIAYANRQNQKNAARINAKDDQVRNLAKQQGKDEAVVRGALTRYSDSEWMDGTAEFEEFRKAAERHKDGKLSHYEIEECRVLGLMEWKNDVRKQGGAAKAGQPLTRGQVLQTLVKKNIPKKRR